METVEAIYENGKIKFLDKNLPRRKFRVLVTFLEEVESQLAVRSFFCRFLKFLAISRQKTRLGIQIVPEFSSRLINFWFGAKNRADSKTDFVNQRPCQRGLAKTFFI